MTSLVRSYGRLNSTVKLTVRSALTAVAVFLSTLLGQQLQLVLRLEGPWVVGFTAMMGIAVVALLVLTSSVLRTYAEVLAAQEEATKRALAFAHSQTDQWVAKSVERLGQLEQEGLMQERVFVPDDPVHGIQLLVQALYQTMDAHFSKPESIGDRIEFEVTFMTKSYRDGKITIAAWANRECRKPKSLSMRDSDPDIYRRTVTAEVYSDDRPAVRIIEDTFEPRYNYRDLYNHQRDRIRSSIVYPVLSAKNELLGTVVVHCDRPRFFKETDRRYWRELLEVFSKRIALEKVRLDYAICLPDSGKKEASFRPF
ncbi:MAG: GAF domain-containing protein [Bacillota bacterium]